MWAAGCLENITVQCRIFGDQNSTMKNIWRTEQVNAEFLENLIVQCRMFGEQNSAVQNILGTELGLENQMLDPFVF